MELGLYGFSDRIWNNIHTASEHEKWPRIVTARKSHPAYHPSIRDSQRPLSLTLRHLPTKAQLLSNSGRETKRKKSRNKHSPREWSSQRISTSWRSSGWDWLTSWKKRNEKRSYRTSNFSANMGHQLTELVPSLNRKAMDQHGLEASSPMRSATDQTQKEWETLRCTSRVQPHFFCNRKPLCGSSTLTKMSSESTWAWTKRSNQSTECHSWILVAQLVLVARHLLPLMTSVTGHPPMTRTLPETKWAPQSSQRMCYSHAMCWRSLLNRRKYSREAGPSCAWHKRIRLTETQRTEHFMDASFQKQTPWSLHRTSQQNR